MRRYATIAAFTYCAVLMTIMMIALIRTLFGYPLGDPMSNGPVAFVAVGAFVLLVSISRDTPYERPRRWWPLLTPTPGRIQAARLFMAGLVFNLLFWFGAVVWVRRVMPRASDYAMDNLTVAFFVLPVAYMLLHWTFRSEYLLPGEILQMLDNPTLYAFSQDHREKCRRLRARAAREDARLASGVRRKGVSVQRQASRR